MRESDSNQYSGKKLNLTFMYAFMHFLHCRIATMYYNLKLIFCAFSLSLQKAAEMREKIKILQNEIEILRSKVNAKDR